jgi:hypothetical protein
VSTRITQRTRTSGGQNSFAASTAATFSTRTDDPSLSTMMAPAVTVVLGFGKQSGLQAVSKRPVMPQRSPEPVARRSEPSDSETSSSDVAGAASEQAAVEIAGIDLPAEHGTAGDLRVEQGLPEAEPDGHASQLQDETVLQLTDPIAETAALSDESEPADEPNKPAHPHRIEMTIDSLPHHDLTEPIPIYIDPLGDTVFTASVAHLDICATGNSIGEAMVLLKEQIEFKYGDLNRRPKRSPEQTTMLQMLHTYIPATGNKPSWL